nr:eukaryotic translation initiation factor 4B2-like [Neodiprion pinetum]
MVRKLENRVNGDSDTELNETATTLQALSEALHHVREVGGGGGSESGSGGGGGSESGSGGAGGSESGSGGGGGSESGSGGGGGSESGSGGEAGSENGGGMAEGKGKSVTLTSDDELIAEYFLRQDEYNSPGVKDTKFILSAPKAVENEMAKRGVSPRSGTEESITTGSEKTGASDSPEELPRTRRSPVQPINLPASPRATRSSDRRLERSPTRGRGRGGIPRQILNEPCDANIDPRSVFDERTESLEYIDNELLSTDVKLLCMIFSTRESSFAKSVSKSSKDFSQLMNMIKEKYNLNTSKRATGETLPMPMALFSPLIPACTPRSIKENGVCTNIHPQVMLIAVFVDDIINPPTKRTPLQQMWQFYLASFQSQMVPEDVKLERVIVREEVSYYATALHPKLIVVESRQGLEALTNAEKDIRKAVADHEFNVPQPLSFHYLY